MASREGFDHAEWSKVKRTVEGSLRTYAASVADAAIAGEPPSETSVREYRFWLLVDLALTAVGDQIIDSDATGKKKWGTR